MGTLDRQFDAYIRKHLKESEALIPALDKSLEAANCRFGHDVIPSFIKPYFLSHREETNLKKAAGIICGMLEKVVQAYFDHPEIRPIFNLDKDEEDYVEMDPGYKRSIVISRPDGFLVNGSMRFIEFNCDSPAGAGYSDIQERILRKTKPLKHLHKTYQWGSVGRLSGLLSALLDCWKQFGSKKTPRIAIVDWKHLRTLPEFEIIRDYFISRGYPTIIADPRELKLKSGKLCCGTSRVDLIYRRVIFKELWAKKGEVSDLLKAYRLGKVCVVNPFRSKLAANKAVLSILTNPAYEYLFTKKEMKIRDKHIPWTRRVIDAEKFYGGRNFMLSQLILEYQKNLVLKPAEGYGGRGVKIGRETSVAEWKRTIKTALHGAERWVVQEYVPIPEMTVPVLKKGKVRLIRKKINLNPFVFNGHYVGSMARLSQESVINVSAGGGLIPAVQYQRKT